MRFVSFSCLCSRSFRLRCSTWTCIFCLVFSPCGSSRETCTTQLRPILACTTYSSSTTVLSPTYYSTCFPCTRKVWATYSSRLGAYANLLLSPQLSKIESLPATESSGIILPIYCKRYTPPGTTAHTVGRSVFNLGSLG